MTGTGLPEKAAVRAARLAARRSTPRGAAPDVAARARTEQALADRVLALTSPAGGTVACYASLAEEPPTALLRARLRERGARVLLPVLLADGDLDWAVDSGATARGRLGITEASGPRLGVAAAAAVDLWVVPALACDEAGHRLGRGGGSYDRALARARPGAVVVALLHDGEVLPHVPVEPHDRPVDIVVTPSRTLLCSR